MSPKPHEHAGVYTPFDREVTYQDVADRITAMLGDRISKLIEDRIDLAIRLYQAGAENDEEHPVHKEYKKTENELHEEAHARLKGRWTVDRYNAPIEFYAHHVLNGKPHGHITSQKDIDGINFHSLPPQIRAEADKAMKKDHGRPVSTAFEEIFENLFTTQGISTLWHQAANDGATNSGGSAPAVKAWFSNSYAVIGVGDSTTAAANTQYDLQAGTNRLWVAMDVSYPTLPATNSGAIVFRSTFTSAQANYSWQEFAVANDNGSNVSIPGSTARGSSNGTMLDRVVSNQGTKASGQTWQPSLTLTIS